MNINYNKIYKFLVIIPLAVLVLSLFYIYNFYQKNNDFILKDVSLRGGTSVTVYSQLDLKELRSFLSERLEDYSVREISDLRTGEQQAVIIEVPEEPEKVQETLEEFLGFKLDENNSSIEFTGAVIGSGFYRQLQFAILISFILMSIVVFIIFRTFVPGMAVILSAFSDIVMTLALVNLLGIRVSAAGIVAFLMLIGYSVDSDILLTTRVLKSREDVLNKRILSAFKTGITMTLTSIAAVVISLAIVYSLSTTLAQIFTILTMGLCIDIANTWLANAGILKWYAERKKIE